MGVLVVIHVAGDPNRLAEAYEGHRGEMWADVGECPFHVAARMSDGFLIADEWVSETTFRSRYVGSRLDEALTEAGGKLRVHVGTVVDRRAVPTVGHAVDVGAIIDDAALEERVVPRDS